MIENTSHMNRPLSRLLNKRATLEPRSPLELRLLPTPWGEFSVALTTFGEVAAIQFPGDSGEPQLEEAGERARINHPNSFLIHRNPLGPDHPLARRICNHIRGNSSSVKVNLALGRASEFDRAVWNALLEIPSGETVSYGDLAERIERPGAARAVGGALGRNPAPILIPCHRVIRSDGGLGGFSGGPGWKGRLLALERNGSKP